MSMISRQKLIEEVKKALNRDSIGLNDKWNLAIARVIKIIESQPPADQWIPCSSGRFPTEKGWYFVTTDWNGGYVDIILYYPYIDGKFEDYIKRRFGDVEILAWMPLPLPEPYKGEQNDR